MTDPISFSATTPRHKLPNLFSGQAQKEFTLNEAFARLDAIVHTVVEGTATQPPANPADGESWIVGDAPGGAWAGHSAEIASWQSGNWIFVTATSGMKIRDLGRNQNAYFDGSWRYAEAVAEPIGGTTQDAEARTAISGLVDALVSAGILSSS